MVGWEEKVEGRAHTNAAEIRDASGQVLARSRGVFIAVDAKRMFREHLEEKRQATNDQRPATSD